MSPLKLTSDANSYIFVWLTGYGAFLAPILGIMLCMITSSYETKT